MLKQKVTSKTPRKRVTPCTDKDGDELSPKAILFRKIAAHSGVPVQFVETGKWRENKSMVASVKAACKTIQKIEKQNKIISDIFFAYHSLVSVCYGHNNYDLISVNLVNKGEAAPGVDLHLVNKKGEAKIVHVPPATIGMMS
jgi:hypothetical protein